MDLLETIKRRILSFDYLMLILVVGLSIFGVIAVGSATHAQTGNTEVYDKQQLWVITGLVLLFLAAFIDYRFISKFYILIYALNLALLVLVLFFSTGAGNVNRFLGVNESFSIQPSEFAKVFMLIYLSKLIDKLGEKINNIFILIGIGISVVIPFVLIMIQPSLSASLVVLTVSLVLIFLGGLSYKYIIAALIITLPSAYLFIEDVFREQHIFVDKIFEEYQIQGRIIPFLKPELASKDVLAQTSQSMQAIGSGQLSGKGLYQGTFNSLSYVPSNHNDFIFAVIGEEFGYAGCICVLAVIFVIILKCLYISYKADTLCGRYLAAGVGFMFGFQTFVNVGVAIGMLPNTGMVLPFISYGGSSMWINMIAAGLVINVGMNKPKKDSFSLFEE